MQKTRKVLCPGFVLNLKNFILGSSGAGAQKIQNKIFPQKGIWVDLKFLCYCIFMQKIRKAPCIKLW